MLREESPMPQAPRDNNHANKFPHMTSLSIAFPMNFESPTPDPIDPRRASTNTPTPKRPPHRHDAGK